nr:hypothetical protein [Tanacetum cinerariifolium]
EEQESRLSEEARIREEEDAEELYRDVAGAVSVIPGIIHQYMDQQIKEAVQEALVEAYEADKAILDTYGESTILKRRREDDDQ